MESVTESLGRASVGTPSTTSKFTLHSSIACPFLVISEVQLVQSKAAPTAAEFAELTATAMAMVGAWEAGRASILADFEGENLGWGGELLCAQFLPTASLDASLRPANQPAAAKTPTCGLLIDARSSAAMAIVRRIMQGEQLTKLIWGADGDLASLRHNILPAIGAVVAKNVVDVQLGFSSVTRRLGMARMLERVPRSAVKGLPGKDLPGDFYAPKARNRRCVALPMSRTFTLYAVDDLHRIEAILCTQSPSGGSFRAAKAETDRGVQQLEGPEGGITWLHNEMQYYSRTRGQQKTGKAVQIARAVRHMEMVFAGTLTPAQRLSLSRSTELITPELRSRGVAIPDDLGFAD